MNIFQIFELSISMVTALLGLAYPLFLDKINSIASTYKSRRLSERFRKEFVYRFFNFLLVSCIVEMFIIPFLLNEMISQYWETIILSFQGISVFVLSMCMVVLYDLLLTYNDPMRLFQRIRVSVDNIKKFDDLVDLMKYTATDEEQLNLYYQCLEEFDRMMLEFQNREAKNNIDENEE